MQPTVGRPRVRFPLFRTRWSTSSKTLGVLTVVLDEDDEFSRATRTGNINVTAGRSISRGPLAGGGMNAEIELTLEGAIRKSGEGWIIDTFAPREAAIDQILQTLDKVNELAKSRFGASVPDLSPQALADEFERNPARMSRVLPSPGRLADGRNVVNGVEDHAGNGNQGRSAFVPLAKGLHVRVILVSPYGDEDLPYESSEMIHFAIFRQHPRTANR